MQHARRRLVASFTCLAATASLSAGLAGIAGPASADDHITIGQTQIGSIFVDSTTAAFEVGSPVPARWSVVDDQGREVAAGQVAPGDVRLEVPDLELGQYTLHVAALDGAADGASTPFALIEGWEGDKDVRFGMNTKFGLPADPPGSAPVWDPQTQTYAQGEARYQQDLNPILHQTGAGGTRDTIAWNQFEPEERLYAGGPDWYDDYVEATAAMDAPPVVILSYGNKLYDVDAQGVGAAPYTEEGIRAYAEYARAVLSRYEGEVSQVEVWNEYNGNAPWNRGPCRLDARCYFEMLKVTYEVVKETHPEADVVGPAGVTIPYGWLDELFSYGALDYLDAVTVHPYGFPASPENGYAGPNLPGVGLDARIDQLDALIREHNGGQSKPIWFTEIGWGSYEAARGVSEATQADYLVRSHVISLASGVDRVYWYSLRNDRTIPTGPGANWGLVRNAGDPLGHYAPKESFTAYTTMTRLLTGAQFSHRDDAPEGVRSYAFTTPDGEQVRAVWSPGGPQDVTVGTSTPVTVTRIDGESLQLEPHDGRVHLTVAEEPIYVSGTVDAISAGSLLTLTAPQTVAAGGELDVTLQVDNSDGTRAVPAFATVEGSTLHVVTPPRSSGEASTTVAAGSGIDTTPAEGQPEQRTRTVLAEVRVRGQISGWLSVEVAVD